MSSQVVTYTVDESTKVSFEIDPPAGFRPASPGHAVGPAVEAAKAVLDKVEDIRPMRSS